MTLMMMMMMVMVMMMMVAQFCVDVSLVWDLCSCPSAKAPLQLGHSKV
jgi:hypothetical protein